MAIKVGDYVRALLITHVPYFEIDVDMTREGLVTEIGDEGRVLVLETWQDNEFKCFAAGAVVVDEATLDKAIQEHIAVSRLLLKQ